TSLIELAAAMAPKSDGSSTMGVKKSTVATRARSGAIRQTAASSRADAAVSTLGSTIGGRAPSTCPSSTGLSLQAQPAPWLYSVNRRGESIATKYQPRYLIAASYTHSAPTSSALTGTRSSAAWMVGEELKSAGMLSGRKPYVRIPRRAKWRASVPPVTRDGTGTQPESASFNTEAKRSNWERSTSGCAGPT